MIVNIEFISKSGKFIKESEIEVGKISQLLTMYSFDYEDTIYLIRIDKDVQVTKKTIMSRLHIIKWNLHNDEYVKSLVLFNNFSNDIELLEGVYASLAGGLKYIRGVESTELKDILIGKLNYYGYDENDTVEITDYLKLKSENSKEVLSTLVGILLDELYNPYKMERLNSASLENSSYFICEKYLDHLIDEGKIPLE